MFDEALVTVWSAPNYCYRCGNLASIMTVKEDGSRSFTVYEAAEENERDKGMAIRKMVCRCCFVRSPAFGVLSGEFGVEC
jgi:serine/threonine-protein phosphatase 6 catalytic subunit